MRQAKPFHETGYSKQEEKAIYQALKKAGLKADVSWDRILFIISTTMVDLSEGTLVPGAVAYSGKRAHHYRNIIKGLEMAAQAYEALGVREQWHLDDQDRMDWPSLFGRGLTTVRQAAEKPNFHVNLQKTGKLKNYAIHRAVNLLLSIFEDATGIMPQFSPNAYADDLYIGNFHKFAVACIAPVRLVEMKSLRSSIYSAYSERHTTFFPVRKRKSRRAA
ncbi:MAG: hypothetical protein OJF51_000122 [Nitrospira sp.]|jgi:hypothetical protein|nr:MAG: hypothetical protein OJF51_000122 [Nitrospira sp.]